MVSPDPWRDWLLIPTFSPVFGWVFVPKGVDFAALGAVPPRDRDDRYELYHNPKGYPAYCLKKYGENSKAAADRYIREFEGG